jgi:hypothetical protein
MNVARLRDKGFKINGGRELKLSSFLFWVFV